MTSNLISSTDPIFKNKVKIPCFKIGSPGASLDLNYNIKTILRDCLNQLKAAGITKEYKAYLTGSSLTARITNFPATEISLQIILNGHDPKTHFVVSSLFAKYMPSTFCTKSFTDIVYNENHTGSEAHFEEASLLDLPLHLSFHFVKDIKQGPFYSCSTHSFFADVKQNNLNFPIFSKEGSLSDVIAMTSDRTLTCQPLITPHDFFPIITAITHGFTAPYTNLAMEFPFLIEDIESFLKKKQVSEETIFTLCNSIFLHKNPSLFIEKLLLKCETYPDLWQLRSLTPNQIKIALKVILPLLSDEISLKPHLNEIHIHAKFSSLDKHFYVNVPFIQDEEIKDLLLIMPLISIPASSNAIINSASWTRQIPALFNPIISSSGNCYIPSLEELPLNRLEIALRIYDVELLSKQEKEYLKKQIPNLIEHITTSTLKTLKDRLSLSTLLSKLSLFIEEPETSDLLYYSILQITNAYKTRLEKPLPIPCFFWKELNLMTSLPSNPNKELWKPLLFLLTPIIKKHAQECAETRSLFKRITTLSSPLSKEDIDISHHLTAFDITKETSSLMPLLEYELTEENLNQVSLWLEKNAELDPWHFETTFEDLLNKQYLGKAYRILNYQERISAVRKENYEKLLCHSLEKRNENIAKNTLLKLKSLVKFDDLVPFAEAYFTNFTKDTHTLSLLLEKSSINDAWTIYKSVSRTDYLASFLEERYLFIEEAQIDASYKILLSTRVRFLANEGREEKICELIALLYKCGANETEIAAILKFTSQKLLASATASFNIIFFVANNMPFAINEILITNYPTLQASEHIHSIILSFHQTLNLSTIRTYVSCFIENRSLFSLETQEKFADFYLEHASDKQLFNLANQCVFSLLEETSLFTKTLLHIKNIKQEIEKAPWTRKHSLAWISSLLQTDLPKEDLIEICLEKMENFSLPEDEEILLKIIPHLNTKTIVTFQNKIVLLAESALTQKSQAGTAIAFFMKPAISDLLFNKKKFYLKFLELAKAFSGTKRKSTETIQEVLRKIQERPQVLNIDSHLMSARFEAAVSCLRALPQTSKTQECISDWLVDYMQDHLDLPFIQEFSLELIRFCPNAAVCFIDELLGSEKLNNETFSLICRYLTTPELRANFIENYDYWNEKTLFPIKKVILRIHNENGRLCLDSAFENRPTSSNKKTPDLTKEILLDTISSCSKELIYISLEAHSNFKAMLSLIHNIHISRIFIHSRELYEIKPENDLLVYFKYIEYILKNKIQDEIDENHIRNLIINYDLDDIIIKHKAKQPLVNEEIVNAFIEMAYFVSQDEYMNKISPSICLMAINLIVKNKNTARFNKKDRELCLYFFNFTLRCSWSQHDLMRFSTIYYRYLTAIHGQKKFIDILATDRDSEDTGTHLLSQYTHKALDVFRTSKEENFQDRAAYCEVISHFALLICLSTTHLITTSDTESPSLLLNFFEFINSKPKDLRDELVKKIKEEFRDQFRSDDRFIELIKSGLKP